MRETIISFHQKLQDKGFFRSIYLLSLVAFAVGLLYSRALLSISQLLLAGAFLLEGGLKEKAQSFINNKIALLLTGIFLIHIVGLIFTEDFLYAWTYIRIKAPLLFYPVILASTNFLNRDIFRKFNNLFILLVFSRTLAIIGYYLINKHDITDMRDAFFLISHIRLSLIVCLSIVLAVYQFIHSNQKWRLMYMLSGLWFFGFMLYFEMITGIFISVLCLPVIVAYLLNGNYNRDLLTKLVFYAGIGFLVLLTLHLGDLILTYSSQNKYKPIEDIEYTINNRPYQQPYKWGDGIWMKENGNLIFQNVSFEELEKEWNLRSSIKADYSDKVFTDTEIILIRFLASKPDTKDSAGVASLTADEIKAIENGRTNVNHIGVAGYKVRIQKITWELDNYFAGENPNGHSSAMRLEFMKTGWHIFCDNFWFGVGTGDQESAFQEQYIKDESSLSYDWRFRAHNQYMSTAVAFGIFGLIYFLIALLLPLYKNRTDMLYVGFMMISLISMFAEDTLDTQIGVAFFAFFNCYFLFREKESDEPQFS